MCVLDYNTIACGDKFGNVFVLRFPEDASDEVVTSGNSTSISRGLFDRGLLNGAPNKLELLCHYYLGEIPSAIVRGSLKPNGKEVLMISTITGGLHALIPARVKDDISFFQHLEMYMRQEYGSLCQRDHLSYRSYYQPVKLVVDGELCARFSALPSNKQRDFAANIDRTPAEIFKKLEEMREFL